MNQEANSPDKTLIMNNYYQTKRLIKYDPEEAYRKFADIYDKIDEETVMRFKVSKQMLKCVNDSVKLVTIFQNMMSYHKEIGQTTFHNFVHEWISNCLRCGQIEIAIKFCEIIKSKVSDDMPYVHLSNFMTLCKVYFDLKNYDAFFSTFDKFTDFALHKVKEQELDELKTNNLFKCVIYKIDAIRATNASEKFYEIESLLNNPYFNGEVFKPLSLEISGYVSMWETDHKTAINKFVNALKSYDTYDPGHRKMILSKYLLLLSIFVPNSFQNNSIPDFNIYMEDQSFSDLCGFLHKIHDFEFDDLEEAIDDFSNGTDDFLLFKSLKNLVNIKRYDLIKGLDIWHRYKFDELAHTMSCNINYLEKVFLYAHSNFECDFYIDQISQTIFGSKFKEYVEEKKY